MSTVVASSLVAILGALVGAFIGFQLNEASHRRKEQERRGWIADVIVSEISYNLEALDPDGEVLPIRSNQIWDRQLPNLLGAFDKETFSAIHRFYIDHHAIYRLAGESREITPEVRDRITELKERGLPIGA